MCLRYQSTRSTNDSPRVSHHASASTSVTGTESRHRVSGFHQVTGTESRVSGKLPDGRDSGDGGAWSTQPARDMRGNRQASGASGKILRLNADDVHVNAECDGQSLPIQVIECVR